MGNLAGFAGFSRRDHSFQTRFRWSLLVGIFSALPFVLFQVVMFVAPGLTPKERRYLYALVPLMILSFVAGAAFGYRVLFPPAVHFLLSFGNDVATPFIRIGNYVNLMISLLFWMGVMFETPVVLFFLAKIGVVTPQFLAKNRNGKVPTVELGSSCADTVAHVWEVAAAAGVVDLDV